MKKETGGVSKEGIMTQVKRLNKGKAVGEDRINNKTWIYMTEEISKPLMKVLEKVWEEGNLPED